MDYTYEELRQQHERELRRARRRREERLRARRRQLMMRRLLVLVVFVALIAAMALGVRAMVVALTDEPKEAKPPAIDAEPIKAAAPVVTVVDEPVPFVYVSAEPIEPVELEKPTTEDLLASGYLTDEISLDYELQMVAREAAETFDIPYRLLLAVMFRESSYNPDAENGPCHGLMQIHQINYEWVCEELAEYGVTDIQGDPADNIMAGAYMLSDLYSKYEDWHLALMAYNCGESGARNLWNQGVYSSQYSWNVHETMESLTVPEEITEG